MVMKMAMILASENLDLMARCSFLEKHNPGYVKIPCGRQMKIVKES
jgi:hypothetical protein